MPSLSHIEDQDERRRRWRKYMADYRAKKRRQREAAKALAMQRLEIEHGGSE